MIYYQDEWVTQYHSDALTVLRELESDSIDLLCTDPPYGISFMGKDWDKALPDKKIWAECLRVLKPGAFAFVMSIPRADCLSRMIISLEDAGFRVDFSPIYWAYASGFPKAQNTGKAVDKRLGAEREVIGESEWSKRFKCGISTSDSNEGWKRPVHTQEENQRPITNPSTPQAKALDGSYGGFQPKPAVEVIIVCMKPLSEKTFVDQALKNQKGITWLDDCRVPTEDRLQVLHNETGEKDLMGSMKGKDAKGRTIEHVDSGKGRFPANLLVSDDVLNDGRVSLDSLRPNQRDTERTEQGQVYGKYNLRKPSGFPDSGSFSRYFDLDKWAQKTFPFLIVPKASKSEKNKGLGDIEPIQTNDGRNKLPDNAFQRGKSYRTNSHPTVKPLKLMSYLITLGSRPGDTVLDPFGGSGTTALASKLLGRKCITSEIEEKYCEISAKRCCQSVMELKI